MGESGLGYDTSRKRRPAGDWFGAFSAGCPGVPAAGSGWAAGRWRVSGQEEVVPFMAPDAAPDDGPADDPAVGFCWLGANVEDGLPLGYVVPLAPVDVVPMDVAPAEGAPNGCAAAGIGARAGAGKEDGVVVAP